MSRAELLRVASRVLAAELATPGDHDYLDLYTGEVISVHRWAVQHAEELVKLVDSWEFPKDPDE